MKNLLRLLSIFILISSFTFIHAQPLSRYAAQIDSLISVASEKYEFNGVILVAEEGKVIYQKAVGYADFKTKRQLTINSMFDLASVSKAFTAMGIMILKEKGQLDYKDNIQKYLPDLPYNGITIRHLLNHTSGLPDYERLFNRKWDRKKIATNDDIWEMLKKHQPKISFSPGEKYEYCNTGYAMLGSIIEKISGMPLRDFLKKNIFEKLDMQRTKVVNRRFRPEVLNDYAYNHEFSIANDGYTIVDSLASFGYVYYLDGIVGDGCVNSTVADMLKWDQALYKEKLVSFKTLQEAFTPPVLPENAKTDYGFGWHINDTPDGRIIQHGGSWSGYINKFVRNTGKKQAVIVLTNNSFKYYPMLRNIVDILHDKDYSLSPVNFVVALRNKLVESNMSVLNNKVEMMLTDTLNYKFDEGSLNDLGYELLGLNRIEDAIEVFKLNVKHFPGSANAYDSLGEAYMGAKQYKFAIKNYERSLQLDSGNKNAEEMLKRLRSM